MSDNKYWFWISSLCKLSNLNALPLLEHFSGEKGRIDQGAAKHLFHSDLSGLVSLGLLDEKKSEYIMNNRDPELLEKSYHSFSSSDISYLPLCSNEYPQSLRQLWNPPVGLFFIGNLPGNDEWLISMVGARSCTQYGRGSAEKIARGLAFSGMSVISGMARGIDSASHRGCIQGGGKSYAVLGCGADVCYPPDARELYSEIISTGGGILSEYPPGEAPLPWRFPLRNRIIAALGKAVIVVEARKRSGSLITAEKALELGRDVFAVPGRTEDKLSEGCNNLIHAGAHICRSHEDVLSSFGLMAKREKISLKGLNREEKRIYSRLDLIPRSADELSLLTGLEIEAVLRVLVNLEFKGYITPSGKGTYLIKL